MEHVSITRVATSVSVHLITNLIHQRQAVLVSTYRKRHFTLWSLGNFGCFSVVCRFIFIFKNYLIFRHQTLAILKH